MAKDPGIHIDALFIAVPELSFNFNFLEYLYVNGIIDEKQYKESIRNRKIAKKAGKITDAAMSGKPLLTRLLTVGSELLTADMVDILAGFGKWQNVITVHERPIPGIGVTDDLWRKERLEFKPLITAAQAGALKLGIQALNAATRGGLPADRSQIFSRLLRTMGVGFSSDAVRLMRTMGWITKEEAAEFQGFLLIGDGVGETFSKARRAKSLFDALWIMSDGLFNNQDIVDGFVMAGIISPRLGRAYTTGIALGIKQWKVFEGAKAAEGWRRRAILMLTGSMNAQLLDFLYEAKIISGSQWSNMQFLEIAARQINDNLLESMVKRRYRVKPGEAPIKTYARAARIDDGDLLRLLADASREASKEAQALAGGIGKQTRARQYNLAARQLHVAMRNMWDGVGYMTIWGEARVAEAAAESAMAMQRSLLSGQFAQLGDALEWQAKAGVDSYISRAENTLPLSRRVYKNMALWQGEVDKRIKLSLLQGKSPEEVARDVRKFISPNVRGGVSYAAMRLARTEINNAFHTSTIRYTRENPWVRGYQWHLSGSHGRPDICNEMAGDDHAGLGPGVYKKASVPGKPHPHCLCYITTVQMGEAEFLAAYSKGRFDQHLRAVDRGNAYADGQQSSADARAYARAGLANLKDNLKKQ